MSTYSFARRLPVTLLCLLLAVVSVLLFGALRFRSASVPNTSLAPQRRALSSRLAMVVLDGVRDDRFRDLFIHTKNRVDERGSLCSVETPPLTFTVSGVYTLGTGDVATLSIVPQNFQAHSVDVDSLPWAAFRKGLRSRVYGEAVWTDLFGSYLENGMTRRDAGPYGVQAADTAVSDAFASDLITGKCDLCIWHDPNLDHLGHTGGIYSASYEAYARRLDLALVEMIDRAGPDVSWLITSDHGMTSEGNHGGPQLEARASFLAAMGKGIQHTACEKRLQQEDIPFLGAALLGTALPFAGLGKVPAALLAGLSTTESDSLAAEGLHQKKLLAKALSGESDWISLPSVHASEGENQPASASIRPSDSEEAQLINEIRSKRSEASRVVLLISLVPLALAIFWTLRQVLPLSSPQERKIAAGMLLSLAAFGWWFSNGIYPVVLFSTAAAVYFGSAFGILGLAAYLAYRTFLGQSRSWTIFAMLALALTAESHWVAFLQPLVLAYFAALLWRTRTTLASILVFGSTFLFFEALTLLGWVRVIHWQHATFVDYAAPLFYAASGLAFAWFVLGGRPQIEKRAGMILCALAVALTAILPLGFRPYACLTVLVLTVAASVISPRLKWKDTLMIPTLMLFQCQMGPIRFAILLALTAFGLHLLRRPRHLSPAFSAITKAAVVLSLCYVWFVSEGSRFEFTDLRVLVGLLDGSVPMILPITAALTCLYYAAPLVLILFGMRMGETNPETLAVRRYLFLFIWIRVFFYLGNFLVGTMAFGSWSSQIVETLFLIALGTISALIRLRETNGKALPLAFETPGLGNATR